MIRRVFVFEQALVLLAAHHVLIVGCSVENFRLMMADQTIVVREVVRRSEKNSQQKRRFWTPDEVNDLVTGINRYGVGNWVKMLDDETLDFGDRTNTDLKV
jgi:hypothetical protein